jgi:glycosyltransferase involved in cell wall biosynthesis
MKVLVLGNGNSIHVEKWVNGLVVKGIEIVLFSLNDFNREKYSNSSKLSLFSFGLNDSSYFKKGGSINKINYLRVLPTLKKIIKEHQPDIVHSHFCSSYGSIGALLNFHPYIISVWGSDIYDFPNRNPFFKRVVKFALKRADMVLSTSNIMAREIEKYTNKEIQITPFGVDTSIFKKRAIKKETDDIIIGTIKTLDYLYGIDTLIESFHILLDRCPKKNLKLEIVGTGTDEKKFKELVIEKKLTEHIRFIGFIPNSKVPEYLSRFDVYVALSRSESFGVAVVEAMACETPVVVSDVDGFSEVVVNNVCGFLVPKENPKLAADKIEEIISNQDIKNKFAKNGRQRVINNYKWSDNLQLMIDLYEKSMKIK